MMTGHGDKAPAAPLLVLPNPDFYGVQKHAALRFPPMLFSPALSPKPAEIVAAEGFYESCAFRAALGTVGGFGFGLFLGLLLQSTDPALMPNQENVSLKQVAKDSARSALRMGKNMAVVGGMLMAAECTIEECRARTDRWNPILGGCLAGSIMGFRLGAKSAVVQCMYFAAFSAAIDAFQSRH